MSKGGIGMAEDLYHRIGVDIGRRAKLEDGIDWAASNGVRYVDIQLDYGENAFTPIRQCPGRSRQRRL
jgi:hypothetical protein